MRHSRASPAPQHSVEELLPAHTSVNAVSEKNGKHEYQLTLSEDAEPDSAAAAVASAVLSAGGELYQLHTEVRDLEAVFREVNLQEDVAHAA